MGDWENIALTCNGVTVILDELPHWKKYGDLIEELDGAETPESRKMLSILYDELYEAIYGEAPEAECSCD